MTAFPKLDYPRGVRIRSPLKVHYDTIAKVAGRSVQTIRAYASRGKFDPRDLGSIVRFVVACWQSDLAGMIDKPLSDDQLRALEVWGLVERLRRQGEAG